MTLVVYTKQILLLFNHDHHCGIYLHHAPIYRFQIFISVNCQEFYRILSGRDNVSNMISVWLTISENLTRILISLSLIISMFPVLFFYRRDMWQCLFFKIIKFKEFPRNLSIQVIQARMTKQASSERWKMSSFSTAIYQILVWLADTTNSKWIPKIYGRIFKNFIEF